MRTWAPWVWGTTTKALCKSTSFTFLPFCVGLHWNKWRHEMEKTHYWKKCSPTLIFNFKQVHEQQCLKVTQCSMMNWCSDSIVLPSWWVAPTFNNSSFAHPLSIICPVNVLYFQKFCPVFFPVFSPVTTNRKHVYRAVIQYCYK